jgi:hypothetical protein
MKYPFIAALLLAGGAAQGQIASMSWRTVDGGGGTSTAGGFTVHGTIGQTDAGILSGGGYAILGGFWGGIASTPQCYANCDHSTTAPILNANDFICFQIQFVANNPYANCDQSTTPPILNANDFICFLAKFATGCS